MLVVGSILGCRTTSLAIAAAMSLGRSPFSKVDLRRFNTAAATNEDTLRQQIEETKKRNILDEREKMFKMVGNSDHALIAAVFAKWNEHDAKQKFCDLLGLSPMGLRDMRHLVMQYDSALKSMGFAVEKESDANSKSWRVVRSCVIAALAPSQLVRIQRPSTKYSETLSGALEKDAEAKEIKLYVRVGAENTSLSDASSSSCNTRYHGIKEERVFIHPSSSNFSVGHFNCPWLVYHELVRTSKPFLQDATECSAYALLLFGGDIEVQASNGLILVDGWVRLSASARIGALIGGLRRKVDELLSNKVANPRLDITGSTEIKTVVKLLVGDGLRH